MIFFTRRGKLSVLNKAILYIKDNEITDKIKIVHCYEKKEDIPPKLAGNVKIMDRCYPKCRVDLVGQLLATHINLSASGSRSLLSWYGGLYISEI